jgi:hypothetical protein
MWIHISQILFERDREVHRSPCVGFALRHPDREQHAPLTDRRIHLTRAHLSGQPLDWACTGALGLRLDIGQHFLLDISII